MIETITTANGDKFERRAWTGGNVPPLNWDKDLRNQRLITAFYDESVKDFEKYSGQVSEETKSIFKTRAILDAWRTLNSPIY